MRLIVIIILMMIVAACGNQVESQSTNSGEVGTSYPAEQIEPLQPHDSSEALDYSFYHGQWYGLDYTMVELDGYQASYGTYLDLIQIEENKFHLGIYEVSMPPTSRIAAAEVMIEFSTDGTATFSYEDDGWGTSGSGTIKLMDEEIFVEINSLSSEEYSPEMRLSGGEKRFYKNKERE